MILDKILDQVAGKLEKMVIEAYESVEDVGKLLKRKKEIRVLINPETYSLKHTVVMVTGDSATNKGNVRTKLAYMAPKEITLDFLFDNTGIIDGEIRNFLKKPLNTLHQEIEDFRDMLMAYKGSAHQPYVVQLAWGKLHFVGRAQEMDVTYKLFDPDGSPKRAVAKVKFIETTAEEKWEATVKPNSPDLTHVVQVKDGDTLPLLCQKIYGHPKYYLQVAAVNGLGNFRQLPPGLELVFPPINKTAN